MDITGTQLIPAPQRVVWDALNDPAVLKRCLPGCESVERTDDQTFKVIVAAAIGPLRARFQGVLRMTEARPPESCVMVFEGQGGAVGFGKGAATVGLKEAPGGTELTYSAQAQVGGKLAQVGSRLVEGVARKMSDDFFKAFKQALAPADAAAVRPAEITGVAGVAAPAVGSGAPAAPAAATATPAAVASHAAPQPVVGGPTLVPGWWLAVAAVLGSAATIAGNLLSH